ncbi:Protein phosphatase 1D [Fragariocoptes setiger]|uniref:Protein phosphatase 1D n=1 Tax=Fragariocoptes setiger TaxID=1670756 RepID=A0ABQ7S5P3_9ACAR|nr:Protein phosphatase 1D [Fragariocoptes setiger]
MRSMPFSALRCFAHCIQGERTHMEDGHGGKEAAEFARTHLLENIVAQPGFWTNDDDQVLNAIKKGFRSAHLSMHNEIAGWPRSNRDLPSTAGTTASVIFIKNGKYYTGHVGDSRIVLASENKETGHWISRTMTTDHKPESPLEKSRIEKAGGSVAKKNGVDRVVWDKPVLRPWRPVPEFEATNHFDSPPEYRWSQPTNYPIHPEYIKSILPLPFLAVARSLGDLWSYNGQTKEYIVSPDPDVEVRKIDSQDRAIILASDGLWNMVNSMESVRLLQELVDPKIERALIDCHNFKVLDESDVSASLVDYANQQWKNRNLKADNTSAIVILLEKHKPNRISDSSSTHVDKTSCLYCSCSGVDKNPDDFRSRLPPVIVADSSQFLTLKTRLSLSSFPIPGSIIPDEFSTEILHGSEQKPRCIDESIIHRPITSPQSKSPSAESNEKRNATDNVVKKSPSIVPNKGTVIESKRDAQTQANMPATPHVSNYNYNLWPSDTFIRAPSPPRPTIVIQNVRKLNEGAQEKLNSASSCENEIISEMQKVVQRVRTDQLPTLKRKLVQDIDIPVSKIDIDGQYSIPDSQYEKTRGGMKVGRYDMRRRMLRSYGENVNRFASRKSTRSKLRAIPSKLTGVSKCSNSIMRITRSKRAELSQLSILRAKRDYLELASNIINRNRLRPRHRRK